jgi:hypothetical protein
MDAVYSYCLLRLLVDLPEGRASLVRLLEDWPDCGQQPKLALESHFPALSISVDSLRKWWTLGVARLAATAEGTMLGADESEKLLVRLLQVEVAVHPEGRLTRFELEQFEQFLTFPDSRRALQATQNTIIEAASRVHFLFQPVLGQYERILVDLLAGKKRGIAEKIRQADQARIQVRQRLDGIADVLNHYEATQIEGFSGAFGGLLKTLPPRAPAKNGTQSGSLPPAVRNGGNERVDGGGITSDLLPPGPPQPIPSSRSPMPARTQIPAK